MNAGACTTYRHLQADREPPVVNWTLARTNSVSCRQLYLDFRVAIADMLQWPPVFVTFDLLIEGSIKILWAPTASVLLNISSSGLEANAVLLYGGVPNHPAASFGMSLVVKQPDINIFSFFTGAGGALANLFEQIGEDIYWTIEVRVSAWVDDLYADSHVCRLTLNWEPFCSKCLMT